MKIRISLLSVLALLVLAGQGCFSFGGGQTPQNDGGVFKTADAGERWQQLVRYPTPTRIQELRQLNTLALEIDRQDPSAVYMGARSGGLFYSYNGALSWQRPDNTLLRNVNVTEVAVDPSDVCTVYVVSSKRLHKTDDCSRSYSNQAYVETRGNVNVTHVAVDWFNSQVVWLGLDNGDVLKSEDGADTWRTVHNAGSDVTDLIVDQQDSRRVLVATERDGFARTDTGGQEWTQVQEGLKEWRNADRTLHLTQSNDSAVIIAATDYGLLRSFDFGATWEPIQLLTAPGDVEIGAVEVVPTNADRIYYTADATLYRSSDGGESWTTKRIPTNRTAQAIAIDPEDGDVVYVGVATE